MGYGFTVECKICGYVEHFNIGVGFYHCNLERICSDLHYTLKSKVKQIIDNHPIRKREYDRLLVSCPKCFNLTVKDYIKIHYDKRRVFESSLTCSRCNEPLQVIEESTPLDNIPCPQCLERKLTKSDEVLWD